MIETIAKKLTNFFYLSFIPLCREAIYAPKLLFDTLKVENKKPFFFYKNSIFHRRLVYMCYISLYVCIASMFISISLFQILMSIASGYIGGFIIYYITIFSERRENERSDIEKIKFVVKFLSVDDKKNPDSKEYFNGVDLDQNAKELLESKYQVKLDPKFFNEISEFILKYVSFNSLASKELHNILLIYVLQLNGFVKRESFDPENFSFDNDFCGAFIRQVSDTFIDYGEIASMDNVLDIKNYNS